MVIVEPELGWKKDKLDFLEIVIKKDDEKRKDLVLSFGPLTRFMIEGSFMFQAATTTTWSPITAATSTNLMLQPNWMRHHIKSFEMYHNDIRVFSSDENKFVVPWTETMLYSAMDDHQKNRLFPEPWNPGRAVPTKNATEGGGWSFADDSEWSKYAADTWGKTDGKIEFGWIPHHTPPFFQGKNYMDKKTIPNFLPTPALGNITIRIQFNDNFDSIFRKNTANTTKYMWEYLKFNFHAEYVKLSQSYKNTSRKK